MILRTLLLCFFLLMQNMAIAGDRVPVNSQLGRIAIKIPAGLNGRDRLFPNKGTELLVFYSQKESPPTLLQLTQVLIPAAPLEVDEKTKQEAAAHFLTGFLQTFSQNVQEWKRSPIDKLRLGQYAAVRATWTGHFHGLPTTGTMYMLVLGKESYCLHTFGQMDLPNPLLQSSIRAIEALHVER